MYVHFSMVLTAVEIYIYNCSSMYIVYMYMYIIRVHNVHFSMVLTAVQTRYIEKILSQKNFFAMTMYQSLLMAKVSVPFCVLKTVT